MDLRGRTLLLAVVTTSLVAACASTADDPTSVEPLNAVAEDCPAQLPNTTEPTGAAIDREQFGCFGACGPSCKAACVEDDVTITRTLSPAADGTPRCQTCTYHLKSCKSHEFCRWHDDCYRQCDLRWDAASASAPANVPWNPCYRSCDNPVAHADLLCAANWSQVGADTPSVSDACWDGSFVAYSNLTAQHVDTTMCAATKDSRPRPFASDQALYAGTATPPATLPEGYSCTFSTDCPDRNQRCDIFAGSIWGINGPGLCVDIVPSPKVDVKQLLPAGTWTKGQVLAAGTACSLGYQCKSGTCANGTCAP